MSDHVELRNLEDVDEVEDSTPLVPSSKSRKASTQEVNPLEVDVAPVVHSTKSRLSYCFVIILALIFFWLGAFLGGFFELHREIVSETYNQLHHSCENSLSFSPQELLDRMEIATSFCDPKVMQCKKISFISVQS